MKHSVKVRNQEIARQYMAIQKTNSARFDEEALRFLSVKYDLTFVALRAAINEFTKTTRELIKEGE
jgi:hypothetical protein